MSDTPYPITSKDPAQAIVQMKQLLDELFQERIAGLNLGDVFSSDESDYLTLSLSATGGLEKSGGQLTIKAKPTGSITLSSDGIDVIGVSTTKPGLAPILPNDATKFLNGAGAYTVPTVVSISNPVRVETDTYTAQTSDFLIVCNKAGAMTINLPAATGSGRVFMIKNINTGAVTVDASGSETIDSITTQTVNQWESLYIIDYISGKWVIV